MTRNLYFLLASVAVIAVSQLGGCYYMQAVGGQLELMRKRVPIVRLLDDPSLPEEVRAKLEVVQAARAFSVDYLQLPDNGSYTTYADLERDFVVWNVFAAPEFSLQPKTWCFPVVGCVAYRGYFSEDAAQAHAERLVRQGYDVYVGGVPAYSTLGRFDDPVLNTMLRWSDVTLTATLFHELAHQKLFVKGDTAFNEAFATAVSEAGIERWLALNGDAADLQRFRSRDRLRLALREIVADSQSRLTALYASDRPEADKREAKETILDELARAAQQAAIELGFQHAGWLRAPLNNARLASVGLYRGYLPAFRQIMAECRSEISCFYSAAEKLAALDSAERHSALRSLSARRERRLTSSPITAY